MRVLDIMDVVGREFICTNKNQFNPQEPDSIAKNFAAGKALSYPAGLDNMTVFHLAMSPYFGRAEYPDDILQEICPNVEERKRCRSFIVYNNILVELLRGIGSSLKDAEDDLYSASVGYRLSQKGFNPDLAGDLFSSYSSSKHLLIMHYAPVAMFREWLKTSRQVYSIDIDFMNILKDTQKLKMPLSCFKNLPFNTFVLQTSDESLLYMVHVEVLESCNALDFNVMRYDKKTDIVPKISTQRFIGLVDEEGCLVLDKNSKVTTEYYGDNEQDFVEDMLLLQFCTYLISEEPDITLKQHKKPQLKGKRGVLKPISDKNLSITEVGFRYGNAIRLNKDKVEAVVRDDEPVSSASARKPVSPYIRCAHWHSYWVGKKDGSEKRRLIVKWLPPTFCAGVLNDVVVHKIVV